MGMYYCVGCDDIIDNDYSPMAESELCPECEWDREERQAARDYEISQRHAQWCAEKGMAK